MARTEQGKSNLKVGASNLGLPQTAVGCPQSLRIVQHIDGAPSALGTGGMHGSSRARVQNVSMCMGGLAWTGRAVTHGVAPPTLQSWQGLAQPWMASGVVPVRKVSGNAAAEQMRDAAAAVAQRISLWVPCPAKLIHA
jgi:hypothetical protein